VALEKNHNVLNLLKTVGGVSIKHAFTSNMPGGKLLVQRFKPDEKDSRARHAKKRMAGGADIADDPRLKITR